MLVYSKKTFTFTFIYQEMEFEVLYIKEYWNEMSGIESSFEVQGNINHILEVEEILNENEDIVVEILENDLELEIIKEEEFEQC